MSVALTHLLSLLALLLCPLLPPPYNYIIDYIVYNVNHFYYYFKKNKAYQPRYILSW